MTENSTDTFIKIESAAHTGAFGNNPLLKPSEKQIKAGNYKLGKTSLYGIPIAIEQPRDSYREGTDPKTGKQWRSRLAAHYGYFINTKGNDGDGIDCFIGPYPQAENIYIINQFVNGVFDEHKIMLAYLDEYMAKQAYLQSYDKGWNGLHSMIKTTVSQFKWWLKYGNKTKPVDTTHLPYEGSESMSTLINWDKADNPEGMTIDQLLYRLRRDDSGEGLLLDSCSIDDILEKVESTMTFDALVTPFATLERKMNILKGVMEKSGDTIKPLSMQVSDPFKQNGVAQVAVVFEMSDGQTISIYFHNPDSDPKKLAPDDEMISWKWLLNKKDITISVAPEKGRDLNVRNVASRIIKLAEKNSAAFARNNTKRAERMKELDDLKTEIVDLESELKTLQNDLEVAKVEQEDRQNNLAEIDISTPEGYAQVMANEYLKLGYQDALDSFLQERIIKVRNALRGLGWDGKNFGDLSKNGVIARFEFQKVGSGANVVGYFVNGINDDLTKTAEQFAASINDLVTNNAEIDQPAQQDINKMSLEQLESHALNDESLLKEFDKTRLLNHDYTKDELLRIIENWIVAGDETGYENMVVEAEGISDQQPEATQETDNVKLLDEYIGNNEGDLFKGTRKYFQSELQGKVVSTSIGDVRITGKSWNKIKAGMKRDELKVKLIPYALDILKTGKVTGPSPLSKPRKDGIVEFYFFEKEMTIGDYIITAGGTVGKDTQGNLLYNISHDESVSWAKRKGLPDDSRKIAVSQESLKDSENATLDSTIDPREGKINIFILKVIDKNTGERLYDLEDNAGSQDTQQSKEPLETSIDDVDPIAKKNIKTAGLSKALERKVLRHLVKNTDSKTLPSPKALKAIAENTIMALGAELKGKGFNQTLDADGFKVWEQKGFEVHIRKDSSKGTGYLLNIIYDGKYIDHKYRVVLDSTTTIEEAKSWKGALPFDLDVKAFVADIVTTLLDTPQDTNSVVDDETDNTVHKGEELNVDKLIRLFPVFANKGLSKAFVDKAGNLDLKSTHDLYRVMYDNDITEDEVIKAYRESEKTIDELNPGDTAYMFWKATGKDEPVIYRGRKGDNAIIVKDGQQMQVLLSDLKIKPDEQTINQTNDQGTSEAGNGVETGESEATPSVSDAEEKATELNVDNDFKSSVRMIMGIDDKADFAQGFERSLFVNSITGRLKTLHKNGEQQKVDDVLSYIRQKQEGRKAILSARNSAWKLESDSDNPASDIEETKPGGDKVTETTQATTQVEGQENPIKSAFETELNSLKFETDIETYDKRLDEIVERIEKAGLMEEMDFILNETADVLTELLFEAEKKGGE